MLSKQIKMIICIALTIPHNDDKDPPISIEIKKFVLAVAVTIFWVFEVAKSKFSPSSSEIYGGRAIFTYGIPSPLDSSSESYVIDKPFSALLNIDGFFTFIIISSYPEFGADILFEFSNYNSIISSFD